MAKTCASRIRRTHNFAVQCMSESGEGSASEGYTKGASEAASFMVDCYVRDNMVVGVGASGPAARAAIKYLAEQIEKGYLKGVRTVPMSLTAASELAFHGIPITSLEDHPEVDFAFDYVDEVDEMDGLLPFIKGRPASPVQPNISKEREVIDASKMFVAMTDEDGVSSNLGGTLPVMVDGDYWEDTAEELDDIYIGFASIWRRPDVGSAAVPHGGDNPYLSDKNENILDIRFEGPIVSASESYERAAEWIEEVPGVHAHGLYLSKAYAVIVVGLDEYRTLSPFRVAAETSTTVDSE
eukprot:CAMPEP_0118928226 /NCGR_PEP_ID=MMETSP1169-20130426/5531_1 /TAXON_ID=36882 /ORGANISM="Pyramimonas obovata, Strain CCMP722" /LENGTH=295 /DNA_ID=CAMNT_0006870153 /DNA_START=233 /DNA_END=1120 /DNA_ORIENTATION=-